MALSLHKIAAGEPGAGLRGFENWPLVISVVRGMERACVGIARREDQLRLKPLGPGLLQDHKSGGNRLQACLRAAPLWCFGCFVKAFTLDAASVSNGTALRRAVGALNAAVAHFGLAGQAYWLNCSKGDGKKAKSLAKRLLRSKGLGIENNPSNYRLTLRLASDGEQVHGLIGPSISVKERFAYRHKDVGASINPVLAATMVRLAPRTKGGVALDPTCGSGTLLAERMAFSHESEALGIDLSPRAKDAFAANLQAGPSAARFRFQLGTAADPSLWAPCRTVVGNLPFGIRVRQPREDLERLYCSVLSNTADHLEPGGRVILTTSFKRLLFEAFEHQKKRLDILAHYRAEMGGLVYQIVVAARS